MTANLPTGIVTFLFTDIEGSTRLWEQYPETMKVALTKHDAILRQAIESRQGKVFKMVGDSFYAVFASAPEALAAALAAQRALHAEAGRGDLHGCPIIKVRMALHTGAVETRDNDYFGPTLNRVARMLNIGHGGQTLLSTVTEELVRPHLSQNETLRDMGERRLKDLTRPEHIYQLLVPDLPADFPPLRTLEIFRTNLPAQLTSFIGREKEIAAVKQLIAPSPLLVEQFRQEGGKGREGVRLVTLTGPGGTGKTRLSLQVGADLLASFPDGVWFIEFAPLADPALVPQTMTAALGMREEAGRPLLDTLTNYLRAKTALLILDNCEHLVEALAQLAEILLQACPNLRLLASSRESLGISGETVYRVPSLSIPDARHTPPIETLMEYEAVHLFIERAQTALPSFTVTKDNLPAIAQACSRLDGIPLAIELAAARVNMLKVEQIAERLDDRFRLLTGGSRTALPRQQTLQALIDWSYDLLSQPERTLLLRLSVFASGWILETAEKVCSNKDEGKSQKDEASSKDGVLHPLAPDRMSSFILHPLDILDLLTQLINKSLVVVDAENEGETRYRLLETVRQYARQKLAETSEGPNIRDQHLAYFLDLAERAEPQFGRPQVVGWLKRLEAEADNLRVALEWSLNCNVQAGLQLAGALIWFWEIRGYVSDGLNWLSQLLRQPEAQFPTLERAKALSTQGYLLTWSGSSQGYSTLQESLALYRELGDKQGIAFNLLWLAEIIFNQGDYEQGQRLLTESLSLSRALGNKTGIAGALSGLGRLMGNKNYPQARAFMEEGLAIYREIEDLVGMSNIMMQLSHLAIWQNDYQVARRWLDEGLALQRQLGTDEKNVYAIVSLGDLAVREGDYTQACAYYEDSLSLAHETGALSAVVWVPVKLGYIALRQSKITRALKLFEESCQLFKQAGSQIGIVYTLEGLASLAVAQDQHEQGVRLFAWAEATRENLSNTRPPVEQADVDRDLANIRAHLDEAAFAAAQAAGRAMSMDEAIAYALESTHPSINSAGQDA